MKLPVRFELSFAIAVVWATSFSVYPALAQTDPESKLPTAKAPSGPSIPDYGIAQVRRINEQIRTVWEDSKLRPSPAATDNEWCRRLYLDLLGRVPSVTELREFLTSRESNKKVKLV